MAALDSWLWPVVLSPFIGSFLGVIVTRVAQPVTILTGRSCCESCGSRLSAADLIPLLSWVAARGRCRHCGAKLGVFYPLIELGALIVAVWAAALYSGLLLWTSCGLGWMLLTLAVIDFKHFLLPDFLTLPLIVLGLGVTAAFNEPAILGHVIGTVAGLVFVVLLRVLYRYLRGREGMGLGDAKLLAASGAWLSWDGLPSVLLIAAVTGLAFALFGSARGRVLALTDRVPFGTFLCFGTWLVWLYGPLTAA